MSGECKSYKLNEPMNWSEFKSMPDDIKITYIKLIREKFGASDSAIADMFGTSGWSVCQEFKRLAIPNPKGVGNRKWDKEGFLAWVNQVPIEKPVLPAVETQETEEVTEEVVEENPVELPVVESKPCIPRTGSLVFDGRIEDILKTIGTVLNGAEVHLSVHWEVINNG